MVNVLSPSYRYNRLGISLLLIIIGGAVFGWFALNHFPEGDGVEYGFMVPEDVASNTYSRIESWSDVIHSQVVHYRTVNGRFALHCVVQAYCGLLGWKAYAFTEVIMFILFISGVMRLSGIEIINIRGIIGVVMLAFVLYLPMRFDPAYQIGYLWTGAAMAWWLVMWRQQSWRIAGIIGAGVLSVLAGSLHEAFSIAIAGGIVIFFLARKCRFTPAQWVMAVCFALGMGIELAAPGNFNRLNQYEGGSFMGNIFTYMLQLPALWVFLLLLSLHRFTLPKAIGPLYIGGIITGSITLIAMGITYGYATQGVGLLLAISSAILWKALCGRRGGIILCICALATIAILVISKEQKEKLLRVKYATIYKEYMHSPTGVVLLPQPWYGVEYRSATAFALPYQWIKINKTGVASPAPAIYPSQLVNVPETADTNLLIDLGNQGWLMIQSRNHPADFILSRSILGIPAGKRNIEFEPGGKDYLRETIAWRAATYSNEYTPLMTTTIAIQSQDINN